MQNTPNQPRPILKLIADTANKIDSLIGMTDKQVFALRHLIQTTFSIQNIRLTLDPHGIPKTITIQTFDPEGKEFYLKPKRPEILEKMLQYLLITGFVIKFKEKTDVGHESNTP